jgi:hypothetical protein
VSLTAADNISRPLLIRLREVNQPVICMPNLFSRARLTLLGHIWAHLSTSTPQSSTSVML